MKLPDSVLFPFLSFYNSFFLLVLFVSAGKSDASHTTCPVPLPVFVTRPIKGAFHIFFPQMKIFLTLHSPLTKALNL